MEGTSVAETSRRAVLCQVFQDLSNMINTPLKTTGNRVNIWVRNINEITNVNAQTLGLATGFYNVAQIQTPMNSNGGIADNEIWKTIHAGVDSFTNVASLITSTSGNSNSGGAFYHGMMAFNFTNFNWNTNMNLTTTTLHDLYTVALHEVTHALGFASLINVNGASNFSNGYNYYSRYDTFLIDHDFNRLISFEPDCSIMYNNIFINNNANLHPGCTVAGNIDTTLSNTTVCSTSLGFLGSNLQPIEIYTPKCFETGSSLSHFEDQCYSTTFNGTPEGNDEYFVMSNANAAGTIKRFLKPEERTALCDIGYSLRTTYGGTAALSSFNYGGTSCDGTRVAGINDGLVSGVPQFIGNVSTPILITGILNNDANFTYAGTVATDNTANLRFDCIEDVYYDATTTTVTSVGNDASATITFQSSQPGIHLLRYVPFDSVTGDRGNITYVYVLVSVVLNNSTNYCGIPSSCNLIVNGDYEQFEQFPNDLSQITRACNWRNGNDSPTGPGSADYFTSNSPTSYPSVNVPNNFFTIRNSNNNIGNAYAGIYTIEDHFQGISYNEILNTKLLENLLPNSNYQLRFDVSVAGEIYSLNQMRFQALLTSFAPNEFNSGLGVNAYQNFPITPNEILLQENELIVNQNWRTIIINFETDGNANQNNLYIGAIRNVEYQVNGNPLARTYYYIDNVSLIPLPQGQFNLPTQICQTTTVDLANYLGNIPQNGVFSGNGVSLVNGTYIFNPANLALGATTITYTYTDNLGCPPITLTDEFIIAANCLTPYISQIVSVNGDNTFIEVKNPSTTESIIAGSCFLNFYEDGAPTNNVPTSFIDLGFFNPGEVKVFQSINATTPAYAATNTNVLPVEFAFNGSQDIITVSTTHDANSFNNRTDLAGNTTDNWCRGFSLVRSGCATTVPRTDVFDIEDWSRFELEELENVYTQGSRTNPELGRHFQEALHYSNETWNDVPVNFTSLPDRSRAVTINTPLRSAVTGSFECCSMLAQANVRIEPNAYISIENSLQVTGNAQLIVDNNGSLVMVKDSFHGVTNNDLVTIDNPNQVSIFKRTVGLDAYTDYVYWSTPLANLQINNFTNSVNTLFPSPPFNSGRFFKFINANYQDEPNVWQAPNNASGANGYDDNLNDYQVVSLAERNQQMVAGHGYATWTPEPGNDYTINFRGEPNNGIVTVPVFHNEPSNSFPNLIGNPYPSAIDLDRLFEVNTGLIDPVAYVWGRALPDDAPNTTNGGPYVLSYSPDNYIIYNPYLIVSNGANETFNNEGTLSSCQSFFVNTTSSAGTLVFNNSMRTKAANNTFARKSLNIKNDKLWLNILNDNEEKISQTGFAFLENASDEFFSKEDVKTFRNNTTTFYSIVDNLDLVINVQSPFKNSKIIPLGITTSATIGSQLSISIDKKQGVFNTQEIYIYDKWNNSYTEISNSNFTFKVTNTIMDDRFILVFEKDNTENFSNERLQVDVINNKNNVTVKSENNIKIKSIEVFDIYNFSINGLHLLSLKDVAKTEEKFIINEKYKLLLIVTTLEDGSIIYKKIIN